MKVIKTDIEGLLVIEPEAFGDSRGFFMESYSQRTFDKGIAPVRFVQDNRSYSRYGVLRGLHYQREPYAQSKLVSCVVGKVLDVAVDIREGSPTYGQHVAVELSADNHRMKTRLLKAKGQQGKNTSITGCITGLSILTIKR